MMMSFILLPWLALGTLAELPSPVPIAPHTAGVIDQQEAAQDRLDLSDLWVTFGDDEGRALSNIDAQGRSVMFLCETGRHQAYLTHSVMTADQSSVSLVSGDRRSMHEVVAEGPDPEDGERIFRYAILSLDEPVLQAFRETGRMEVVAAGEPVPAVVNPDMKPTVEAFFNTCARR
jgi:hypothetical protein